ncbi:MAG: response regulator [Verrucomicrobia bacterium]|nr:response regulator [Verrucomicrobiota bacterium]
MTTNPQQPYQVLVVDDEPMVCQLLSDMLNGPHYQVTACEMAQQAVDFMERNRVDLAFLDVSMPGMSGFELAEKIRARHPEARLVIITGHWAAEFAEEVKQAGIDRVLQKPFAIKEVRSLVEDLLPRQS